MQQSSWKRDRALQTIKPTAFDSSTASHTAVWLHLHSSGIQCHMLKFYLQCSVILPLSGLIKAPLLEFKTKRGATDWPAMVLDTVTPNTTMVWQWEELTWLLTLRLWSSDVIFNHLKAPACHLFLSQKKKRAHTSHIRLITCSLQCNKCVLFKSSLTDFVYESFTGIYMW